MNGKDILRLSESLNSNSSIVDLDISRNEIEDGYFEKFLDKIENLKFRSLNLKFLNFDSSGLIKFSKLLRKMNSLESLSIFDYHFNSKCDSESQKCFSITLQENTSITELNIGNIKFEENFKFLIKSLKKNQFIKKLLLNDVYNETQMFYDSMIEYLNSNKTLTSLSLIQCHFQTDNLILDCFENENLLELKCDDEKSDILKDFLYKNLEIKKSKMKRFKEIQIIETFDLNFKFENLVK